jgi:hypothetical protein
MKGKRAVVFGAGGSIGSPVAKEFAAEGAEVFLSGRSKSSVEAVAKEIVAMSGRAHSAAMDVLWQSYVGTGSVPDDLPRFMSDGRWWPPRRIAATIARLCCFARTNEREWQSHGRALLSLCHSTTDVRSEQIAHLCIDRHACRCD